MNSIITKKTLLFVASSIGYKNGGESKAAIDIVLVLCQLNIPGLRIVVISKARPEIPYDKYDIPSSSRPRWLECWAGEPIKPVFNKYFISKFFRWFVNLIRNIKTLYQIKRLHPDIIIGNSINSLKFMEECYNYNCSKRAIVLHNAPEKYRGTFSEAEYKGKFEKYLNHLKEIPIWICVSKIVLDKWRLLDSQKDRKDFFIPNHCDEYKVKQLMKNDRLTIRRKLGLPCDKYVVVCPASIQYRKGQDFLVNNIEQLVKGIPSLQILLIGPVVTELKGGDITRLISESSFATRMKLLYNRENILEYIYAADMVVLPTRSECLPLVILESMALKTPIIATNVDGIPEMVENEVSGLLVSPDNSDELIKAFSRMYNSPEERNQFVERAFERYWSFFSRERNKQLWRKAILELLEH